MAIRLIAFSLFIEPSRSRTLAAGRPSLPRARSLDIDQIAVAGVKAIGLGDVEFLVAQFFVDRDDAPAAAARIVAEYSQQAPGGA